MTIEIALNPAPDQTPPDRDPAGAAEAFHRRLPGYAPTPLLDLPELARDLGLGALWVKHEAERFELPAFKILGASYAIYRLCAERLGPPPDWRTLEELRAWAAPLRPLTLLAATDGNHGRAVARTAALLGFEARIFVPAGTAQARIEAIAGEGARVTVLDGSYDDAVRQAAALAGERAVVISDTSWPGYTSIPQDVIDGYSTMLGEIDAQLAGRGQPDPDVALVQVGVGALAAAVLRHYRRRGSATRIVGVEPLGAACALESFRAGRIVSVPGPHRSIMVGMNCGTPSLVVWPELERGVAAWLALDDTWARRAVRRLAAAGLAVGETGAAGLAGLLALLESPEAAEARAALGIGGSSRVLLLTTEGVTDPAMYESITKP
jgi:diaminopropionate ammonia-lyase